jgi:branched-chain amino acid transport system permease protein
VIGRSRRQAPPARRGDARSQAAQVAMLGVCGALALVPFFVGPGGTSALFNLFIYVTMAVMWNLLAGYAGLVSIGQQGFIGAGAYALLVLNDHGVGVYAGVPVSALIAGAIALPVSMLVFRLRGGYFAIGTWVVAEVFRLLVVPDQALGGGDGRSLSQIPSYDPAVRQALTYWAALAVMVASVVVAYLLLRSRVGLDLRATGDDEAAARAVGVRTDWGKRLVFTISGAGCGAVGALILTNSLNVVPDSIFSVQYSAFMIFMVLIGGVRTLEGPIVGALLFYLLEQYLAQLGSWYLVLLGGLAVLVILWFPQGIWGEVRRRLGFSIFPVAYEVRAEVSEQG